MRHLLMPQTKEQAEEFLRLAEIEAARFGVSHTPPQDVEEFIQKHEAIHGRIAGMNIRDWMSGHVRVPVELIKFIEAKEHHLPIEDRHVLSVMLNSGRACDFCESGSHPVCAERFSPHPTGPDRCNWCGHLASCHILNASKGE